MKKHHVTPGDGHISPGRIYKDDIEVYLASDVEALLQKIRDASLDWAMLCEHDCKACTAMYEVICEIDKKVSK